MKGFIVEELVSVLNDIKYELKEMNGKLDDIKGIGVYNSISDVHNKLDSISNAVDSIDFNTM